MECRFHSVSVGRMANVRLTTATNGLELASDHRTCNSGSPSAHPLRSSFDN